IVGHASSTGEILADVFKAIGAELTPQIAEALYIAVVTDTGRFQYANTTAKALRLAAELVEAGADVHRAFPGVGGARRARAPPREPPTANGPTHRVSLRTTEEDLDVSAIARLSGGGGHRQAAGFSSEASVEEITEFIRREFLAQVNGKEPS